jgi:hypothetical protein
MSLKLRSPQKTDLFITNELQYTYYVTDEGHTQAGVPIHDKTPTPVPAPSTIPDVETDMPYPRTLRLKFRTPGAQRWGKDPHASPLGEWHGKEGALERHLQCGDPLGFGDLTSSPTEPDKWLLSVYPELVEGLLLPPDIAAGLLGVCAGSSAWVQIYRFQAVVALAITYGEYTIAEIPTGDSATICKGYPYKPRAVRRMRRGRWR